MRLEDLPDIGLTRADLRWAQHRADLWAESEDASFLLLAAASLGASVRTLAPVYIELVKPRVTTPASRTLLATVESFLAGSADLSALEAAGRALTAELKPAPRGYDWASACAAESIAEALQESEPLRVGWWLSDGLTESLSCEQLKAGADLVRARIAEPVPPLPLADGVCGECGAREDDGQRCGWCGVASQEVSHAA